VAGSDVYTLRGVVWDSNRHAEDGGTLVQQRAANSHWIIECLERVRWRETKKRKCRRKQVTVGYSLLLGAI